MTPEQFAYWLQGYSEIAGKQPTAEQWKIIQDHLRLVFHKVTPSYPQNTPSWPSEQQWAPPLEIIC